MGYGLPIDRFGLCNLSFGYKEDTFRLEAGHCRHCNAHRGTDGHTVLQHSLRIRPNIPHIARSPGRLLIERNLRRLHIHLDV